jgi:hypothetical protein
MNTIIRLIIISIIGCSFVSCELKENTEGVLAADSFFSTVQDLDASVSAAFNAINVGTTGKISSHLYSSPLMGSDDITTHPALNKAPSREYDQFNATSINVNDYTWVRSYKCILVTNVVIENYKKVSGDVNAINAVVAQAYFLRAFCYFDLVRIYGNVPLILSAAPDLTAARSKYELVFEQIISDLKFAETWLGLKDSSRPGKPTKWAAKSLLAHVYLTMAGWPFKDQSKYALARDKSKEVIDGGGYSLIANYADFFKQANNNNAETVFAFQNCFECGVSYANIFTGKPYNPADDGAGQNDVFAEINFFNKFPAGARKTATFMTAVGSKTWRQFLTKHPHYAKWRSGTVSGGDGADPKNSSRTMPIIRYPHLLTMYAEAQSMADGNPNSSSYQYVNMVRRRAQGLPVSTPNASVDLVPGLTATAFRDSVVQERAWEFAGEWTRWHDLVRLEMVAAANANKYVDKTDPTIYDLVPLRSIATLPKEQYYWIAIPKSEIDLNPNIIQNSGY